MGYEKWTARSGIWDAAVVRAIRGVNRGGSVARRMSFRTLRKIRMKTRHGMSNRWPHELSGKV